MLRATLVLAASAVAAWFGLGWVQARDTGRVSNLVTQTSITAGQARQARSLLSTAATLNPDRTVDIMRAMVDARRGEFGRAVAILEPVVKAEPLNVEAWARLAYAAASAGDRRLAAAALHRLRPLLAGLQA
jgi:predicted Zn-dependent protease